MKKTRLCELLGIEYLIIQGGMVWIANTELAAAVSNAGALGIISPTAGMAHNGDMVENLNQQIEKTRSLTKKPFGVNLPIMNNPYIEELIALVIAKEVKVVIPLPGILPCIPEGLRKPGLKSFTWWLR